MEKEHLLLLIGIVVTIIFFMKNKEEAKKGQGGDAGPGVLEDTTREHLKNKNREVTLHYTDWCGACKRMKPVFTKVAQRADKNIVFRYVDEDKAQTKGISGYPTILMLDEYGVRHEYKGRADFTSLYNWVMSVNL
jgi:thiol-disulfide isomerase/thioredoxin